MPHNNYRLFAKPVDEENPFRCELCCTIVPIVLEFNNGRAIVEVCPDCYRVFKEFGLPTPESEIDDRPTDRS